ncbi:amidohydrolase [Tepidanaerobacter syntrophicus]|uniref:amidohydrolase n=1 Tax=Tepidanaerobacter syntrophicus TaxID=224999 RepID=UPI001BD23CA5|nr:amidohydrolase [Tepidanaerobacter syntrophicus]
MIKADLALMNGNVITVDENFSFKEAVAVKNGWIIDVGTNEEVKAYIDVDTEVIDLRGKTVLPGSFDTHVHAAYGGLTLEPNFVNLYFPEVNSIKQINERLLEVTKRIPKGQWIIGAGFSSSKLKECINDGGRFPNRWDFDSTTPDHPILLNDAGLHDLVVNTKALEICGITKETPDLEPSDGIIVRDELTGEPTGYFRDWGAQTAVYKHAYMCNAPQLKKCIMKYQRVLNENGITTHTDIAGIGGDYLFCGTWGSGVIEAYEELSKENKLTARVCIDILAGINGRQSYESIISGLLQTKLPIFSKKNWVKAEAVKIFGDDGWRRDDFKGPRGYCTFPGSTEEEQAANLIKTVIEVHRLGWQMGIHLTGGKGIDTVIDAYIAAQQHYPRSAPRHFIIHGDDLTYEDAKKAGKHKIGLSMQPIAFELFLDNSIKKYAPERAREIFDINTYSALGMICAGSSDAPALPVSWLQGLQFLITRTTKNKNVYWPNLKCSLKDGIKAYTINGAYQNHMDEVCGSIEVNKLADFQVLENDIFEIEENKIGDIPIVMTICDGKIVYKM